MELDRGGAERRRRLNELALRPKNQVKDSKRIHDGRDIRGRGEVAMRNKWLQNGAGRHNRGHEREESFVVELEIWHLWIDALSSNA